MPKYIIIIVLSVLVVWWLLFKLPEASDIPESFSCDTNVKIVYYIPGWNTNNKPQDEQILFLKQRFPNAKIFVHYWDSKTMWNIAKDNADTDVTLLETLLNLSEQDLNLTVVVGHSLGGRITVRTLAKLSDNHRKIRRAILLGAAINYDDKDIDKAINAVQTPIMNFYNPKDATLNKLYLGAEHKSALGCIGNNSVNRLIQFEIPRDLSPYRFTAEKKIIKPNDVALRKSVILLSKTPNATVEEIENFELIVSEKDIDRINQNIVNGRINSESETEVCPDDSDTDVEFDEDGNPLVGATIGGYTFSNFSNHYSYVYLTFFLEQQLPDIEEPQ